MADAEDAGSVRIVLPATYEFVVVPAAGQRSVTIPSGPIRVGGGTATAEEAAVLRGLEQGQLTVVEDREAAPRPGAAGQRALRGPVDESLQVHVDLAADENAVLLLEQDGVYSWQTEPVERPAATAAVVRRGGFDLAATRTVTFEVWIDPRPGAAATRSLGSVVFGAVRTIVLKFIARKAAGAIVDHLDAGIHRGLVDMSGGSAADWRDISGFADVGLAAKDAPRLLLFVHGTFSSTRGSFGALTEMPWGRTFLASAHAQYDAVVGFDHSTLRDDPKTNATELLRLLREVPWKQPPRIDVVTFSRGGLAYRALVEELLPGTGFAPRFERSIFVAVPNAGTHLADPKNWRDLIDLYTNLSAALFRVLGLVPQAKVASMILSEAIAIVGGLVKALASAVADGTSAPGLAAMNPDGPFIAQLNAVSPEAPTIANTYYCYITSNFEADAKGTPPKEIPPKLWLKLADGFVDRLLEGETNDLVVDTKSVPQIDVAAGKFMKESYEFPANSFCYHTNYFTRQEVVESLTAWLRLPQPVVLHSGPPAFELPVDFGLGSTLKGATVDLWESLPAAEPPAPVAPPVYQFLAQMDSTVEVKRPVTIDVTISREQIAAAVGKAAAGGVAPLDLDSKLILEVRPRKNFEVAGATRVDIDVASLGEERTYYFDVMPTEAGEGEVRVIARQGQTPLLILTLKATIVEKLTSPSAKGSAGGSAAEPAPSKPFHKLTIWENESGGKTVLTFELEAPELGLFDKWLSAPIQGPREDYVKKLYKELEGYWAQSAGDAEEFLTKVRAYGLRLFDELIPEPLRKTLWDKRDALKSIMIVSEEPFLPWELLHLHAPDKRTLPDEVLFLGQLGLVRWLHGSWPPARLHLRDVRYVIPDYPVPAYVLPNAPGEREFLEQTLGAKPVTPQFKDVQDLLATPDGFDALHFACHGDNDSEQIDARLMLQGRIEGDQYLPSVLPAAVVTAVSRFAENGSHPIVVLNACQVGSQRLGLTTLGGFAQAFLGAGAGAFVAPLWSVGDREATVFARTFYTTLKAGKSVSEAAIAAREAARTQPNADASWLAYAVYGYPHAEIEG